MPWVTEKMTNGQIADLRRQIQTSMEVALLEGFATLKAELQAAKKEIETDNQILADRQRIYEACQCPYHGDCTPHVVKTLGEIAALKEAKAELLAALNWYLRPGVAIASHPELDRLFTDKIRLLITKHSA